jgi:L-ribulose-5-phosphate 4-epimerase
MTEGYIKFQCKWEREEIRILKELFQTLEWSRSQLFKLGLIGMYPDGIGFGNISVRAEGSSFLLRAVQPDNSPNSINLIMQLFQHPIVPITPFRAKV